MDYETVKVALIVLNMAITLILSLLSWIDRKQRASTKSIKELEVLVMKKFDDKCARLSKLEVEIRSVPTRDEILRLHERIDDINTNTRETSLLLGEIMGQIKQMNAIRK